MVREYAALPSAPVVDDASDDYRRGYRAGYSRGLRHAAIQKPNEHAELLAKQLKWSSTSGPMRSAIQAAIAALTPPAAAPRVEELVFVNKGDSEAQFIADCEAEIAASEDGLPQVEGLTPKQAWWAGARAALGLAADTPRTEVARRLATADPLLQFKYDQLKERLRNCEAALEERDAQILATPEQPDTEGVPFCPRCGAHPDEQPGSAVQRDGSVSGSAAAIREAFASGQQPKPGDMSKVFGDPRQSVSICTTQPPAPAAEQGKCDHDEAEVCPRCELRWWSLTERPKSGQPEARGVDVDFMQELAETLDSKPDRDSILATIDSLKDMVRSRRLAASGQGVEWVASDADIAAWLERHDLERAIRGTDARCAFEDARSAHKVAAPTQEKARQ